MNGVECWIALGILGVMMCALALLIIDDDDFDNFRWPM